MLKKLFFLVAMGFPCAAQTVGSVNGVASQSIANMGTTATAGTGGVTVNTFVAPDTSSPTKFITASSGGCGSGVALSTAAAGATFTLSDALGTLQVKTDSGGAVAGHLLVGSTVTAGLVMDSGQTSSVNISEETPVCGTALTTVSGGGLVTMNPRSRGSYGHRVDQMNGAALPVSAPVVSTNASGQLVTPGAQAANTVYANCTGSSGAPAFCAITPGMIPNNAASTTGNAATATALATTPTLCSTGQAPTGVLANGNATGCATAGGSAQGSYLHVTATGNTAASTTYCVGIANAHLSTSSSTCTAAVIPILKSGTIKSIAYQVRSNTTGTLSSTASMQLATSSTGTALSGTAQTMNITGFGLIANTLTGLSVTVNAGDNIQLQLVMPAGATSGSSVQYDALIYVE